MNSKKYNIYKNSAYAYITSALLMIAGLVVGMIFNLNSEIIISGSAILNCVLAVLIYSICAFVYLWIRYSVYVGFTTLLSVLVANMLTVAIVSLIRISISESFMMVLLIVSFLTTVFAIMLLGDKTLVYQKTTDREKLVNQLVSSKLKSILLTFSCTLVVVIALIFTFEASIISLIRPLLVGIVASLFVSVFMVTPFWGYFVKEKKIRKQIDKEEEQDYVK